MRSIWKGSIRFGLVNIPVSLYPATTREELKFRMLRASDLSPIHFKRVDLEATQTIDIMDFVKRDKINPMFFHRPYYLDPQKTAARCTRSCATS